MIAKCPGSQSFSQPQPEIIRCRSCGEEVEIWTDEVKVICWKCQNTIMRTQGQSCLDWCKFAKQCVGDTLYAKYTKNKSLQKKQKK